MANGLYDFWKEELHDAAYNIISATLEMDLIDAGDYTRNLSTHDFYNDVPGAAVVATATLAGKSNTAPGNGALDANNGMWSAVIGDESEEVIGWIDTGGASSTDPLVWNMDTFASGMPVTPNGGDINFSFSASGIFSY